MWMRLKPAQMIRQFMYAGGLWVLGMASVWGQEEESAEVYLEAYTDLFQERFFEALKQKGIENYDRAEALLLECKQMQPENPVVDHELAKALAARKQYASAEAYALAAVVAAPSEYWYLHTLMDLLNAQYKDLSSLEGVLPTNLPEIRQNLAQWHLSRGEGQKALEYLQRLPEGKEVLALKEKARSLPGETGGADRKKGAPEAGEAAPPEAGEASEPDGELAAYRDQLQRLLEAGSWDAALDLGREAVERYPLQPYFHLGIGKAQLGKGAYRQALEQLEEGSYLLLEPGPIAVQLYEAMAAAYEALGNPDKAAEFRDKAKTAAE